MEGGSGSDAPLNSFSYPLSLQFFFFFFLYKFRVNRTIESCIYIYIFKFHL